MSQEPMTSLVPGGTDLGTEDIIYLLIVVTTDGV